MKMVKVLELDSKTETLKINFGEHSPEIEIKAKEGQKGYFELAQIEKEIIANPYIKNILERKVNKHQEWCVSLESFDGELKKTIYISSSSLEFKIF